MKKIWPAVRGFFVVIGVCTFVLSVVGAFSLRQSVPALPDNMVLDIELDGTPPDAPRVPAWMAAFMPQAPTLAETCHALYKAAKDTHVSALVVRMNDGPYAWADVQELRTAIEAFKKAGKKTYVYAENYGAGQPGMAAYYLASAFDEVWLQPVGNVFITGFAAEVPYFKSALERVGIEAQIIQKGTYKTAPESALLDEMSAAQRASLHGILASMSSDFFAGVAAGRKVELKNIGALINGAPYTAQKAKEAELVDVVGYHDELMHVLGPREGEDKARIGVLDYMYAGGQKTGFGALLATGAKAKSAERPGVALIYVRGAIVSGHGGAGGGVVGQKGAYADDIAQAIMAAADDVDTRGIVLRVNSPGGSPSASETIRRAVELARKKGKYVVVSMGAMAASGGYWVSVDADRIFAQKGTLSGSIGVFGGKVSFAGLWEKLGVRWDGVSMGAHAGMQSPNRPYEPQEKAATQAMLDDVYDAFVARVAHGRHFAAEVVEKLAQGRVWTGSQALENGLIDEIGGLHAALANVAAALGANGVAGLDVYESPMDAGPLAQLQALFGAGAYIKAILAPVLQESYMATKTWDNVVYQRSIIVF